MGVIVPRGLARRRSLWLGRRGGFPFLHCGRNALCNCETLRPQAGFSCWLETFRRGWRNHGCGPADRPFLRHPADRNGDGRDLRGIHSALLDDHQPVLGLERITSRGLVGLLLGVTGIVLLVGFPAVAVTPAFIMGCVAVLFSCFSAAFGSNYASRRLSGTGSWETTIGAFVLAASSPCRSFSRCLCQPCRGWLILDICSSRPA